MSVYLGTQLLSGVATNTISNAHSLFDFKWSDHIINEMSWLRSDTFSWQDGSVYDFAYNHLNADYNGGTSTTETVGSYTITYVLADDGHKITTDETTVANIYNESGVAWYYILDTTNQRFKLPRENPAREELIQVVRAKGNGKDIGLTSGTAGCGLSVATGATRLYPDMTNGSGHTLPYNQSADSTYTSGTHLGLETDSTKSGIISNMTDSTSVYKGKQYLYFYVGQFSQSATEQTAGLNSELFNGKADIDLSNAAPNASASAKETIVGWGMPDYSAGVSKTNGTNYTAETNGWLEVYVSCYNSTAHATLTLNGVSSNISTAGSNHLDITYVWVPITKGTTYNVTYARTDSGQYINFYPCIGG